MIVLRLFYRNGEDNWPPVQSAIIYIEGYKYWRLCLSICVQQLNMSSVETFWKWTTCIAFLLFIIFNCEVDIFFTVRSHSLSFFRTQSINMINISCFVHLTFHFLITAGSWHLLCLFIIQLRQYVSVISALNVSEEASLQVNQGFFLQRSLQKTLFSHKWFKALF